MNTLIAVSVVFGMVVLVLVAVAVVLWRKLSGGADELRAALGEARQQLEVERQLRLQEQQAGEVRSREREAYLREVMKVTVDGAIEKFKSASGEQLKSNGVEFAEASKRSLLEILDPLKQRIREYDERADSIRQGNAILGTELKGYVETIKASASRIQSETAGFRNDLKFNNKFQGNFGEDRLELVLVRCGFVRGEDFVLQSGEDKKIPDCRVYDHLAKKIVVIDSKMSWKSYSDAFASDDPAVRDAALEDHVKSVRKQIDNLSGKRYHEAKPDREGYSYAPFALLFMPSDGALVAALEKDASLLQYAADRNVYLTSPLNVFNLLRLLRTCIGNFDFAENLGKIALEARHVVERIDGMFAEFEELGGELKKAGSAYEKVMKRLTEGSAENKSSVKASANRMIELSVKHDRLKSRTMSAGEADGVAVKALAGLVVAAFAFSAAVAAPEAEVYASQQAAEKTLQFENNVKEGWTAHTVRRGGTSYYSSVTREYDGNGKVDVFLFDCLTDKADGTFVPATPHGASKDERQKLAKTLEHDKDRGGTTYTTVETEIRR